MFFNYWIQFMYENYLFLGVCVSLNLFYYFFNSWGNGINSIISTFFVICLLLFPVFLIAFYNFPSNFERAVSNNKIFYEKFGSVINHLNLKNGRYILFYPFFDILRKLMLIVTIVYMQDYPVLSVYAIIF